MWASKKTKILEFQIKTCNFSVVQRTVDVPASPFCVSARVCLLYTSDAADE